MARKGQQPAQQSPPIIPLLDLNLSAFLLLNGLTPRIEMDGTRASFLFEATETFYSACKRFNSNEPVPCLDYAQALRRLRSAMHMKRGALR